MYKFRMPKFGMTMQTGFVGHWYKGEGEQIKKGELLLEVESEKIANDIEAPISGFIKKIFALKNEEYPVGTVIALIAENAEELMTILPQEETLSGATSPTTPNVNPQKRSAVADRISNDVKASPAAKHMAGELGVHLAEVIGTGPDGRIIEKDILVYHSRTQPAKPSDSEEVQYETLSPTRQIIARELSTGFHSAVFVTQMTLSACPNALRWKEQQQVSLTAVLAKMVSRTLLEFPRLNAHFDGKTLQRFSHVNLGIAMDTEAGLVVPVIRKADGKHLKEMSEELAFLANAARTRTLTREQLQDSTFTISNVGISRTDAFTPILHFPEVAILGVGRLHKGVQVTTDNSLLILPQLWLSLTYDHRAIDGITAARFLETLCQLLESTEEP
jgi:pyruvate dehydrogenase E2 component (dihydrolipoamide acetyltransferase)